jgi:hypothetical protein
MHIRRIIGCLVVLLNAVPLPAAAEEPVSQAVSRIEFSRDVLPILQKRCFACHEGADPESGIRLDQHAELTGTESGHPLVRPRDSANSILVARLTAADPDSRMPPDGPPLSQNEIGVLKRWIDDGLEWDFELLPAGSADHWAFQPITRPSIPKVRNTAWVRTPVDAFIAHRQEEQGIVPAQDADARTLVRRVYLDLIGLPPTPEEMEAFLADSSPQAYERLVDRLLDSPHYGERWGRHWLDVARWAESEGYESNHPRPFAWRYRDYVVQSLNDDKPFDRFIREQIAGDELEPYSDEQLIATGFLAAARLSSNEEDKWLQRNDVLNDIVEASANAFLGLTMQCARCHDHKFDPLTAQDYYRLQGFFLQGQPVPVTIRDPALWEKYNSAKPPEYDPAFRLKELLYEKGRQAFIAEAKRKLPAETRAALETPSDRRTWEQEQLVREATLKFQITPNRIERSIPDEDKKLYDELKKRLAALENKLPERPQTFAFYSPITSPHDVDVLPTIGFYPLPYEPEELDRARPYVLVRGEVHRRGAAVSVGWPELFGPTSEDAVANRPRTALADWLTSPDNPLVARVWVNRIWHYHFGRGIVATPGNFGIRGAKPTHPELLDFLACELIDNGWSTKHIHRLIVNSSTYRQSAAGVSSNASIDPDNKLWWRWQPRRLESEALRDALLVASGELDRTVGGPSIPPDKQDAVHRRSLYLKQTRDKPPQPQALFDGPASMAESCSVRLVSTTSLQSLYLLNNSYVQERARSVAQRVAAEAGETLDTRVERAFLIILGRPTDAEERAWAVKFFQAVEEDRSSVDSTDANVEPKADRALVHFCHALLNVNEFVILE